MPVNQYFNNYQSAQEQELAENLLVEAIKIYGQDVYYCPRTVNNYNPVFGEDDVSSYDSNFLIEVYVKNINNFTGDGRIMSKFGLEIRDEITFSMAYRSFYDEVTVQNGMVRPNEGDLIFFPLNNKIYVIKYVQHEANFYQLGTLKLYDLVCEQWEYSSERLNTGLSVIDSIQAKYSIGTSNYGLLTEDFMPFRLYTQDGFNLVLEGYDIANQTVPQENQYNKTQAQGFLDFSETNPFGETSLDEN